MAQAGNPLRRHPGLRLPILCIRLICIFVYSIHQIHAVSSMKTHSLELLKGTLDVLVLKSVSRGTIHGYGISRWLRETTDEAFQVEEGALYPALRRLEKKGFLTSQWETSETGRQAKFYSLTPSGEHELERGVQSWHTYVDVMARVLGRAGA